MGRGLEKGGGGRGVGGRGGALIDSSGPVSHKISVPIKRPSEHRHYLRVSIAITFGPR